jgi:hypothetical protein
LTALENRLLRAAGESGYRGGFIENYALSFIYPEGLTRPVAIGLGIGVLAINVAAYAVLGTTARRQGRVPSHAP